LTAHWRNNLENGTMQDSLDIALAACFFAAFAVPAYSYFVFPAMLYVLARLRATPFQHGLEHEPPVTLLISAYNEAGVIASKIENSLALDYPKEKLQILVLDDGSTDETAAIVAEFVGRGITHVRVEGRGGKNAAINEGWPLVSGEITIFSDANSLYEPDAVRKLVAWFADDRIGCVCGELRYISADTGSALGENLYWRYEQYLKRLQSTMGEVLVLNGSIFAIRSALFQPLHPKIANDFQTPVFVSAQGKAIVYEPAAVAVEKVAESAGDEFGRKARIIARGFEGFFYYLPTFRGIRLFQFISQKFLRWMVWLAMLCMLATNVLLWDQPMFRLLLGGQIAFYTLALLGPLLNRVRVPGISIPYYFCIINLGALVGFWRYISRRQKASWEPPASAR